MEEIESLVDEEAGTFPTLKFVFRRPDPIRCRDIRIGFRAFVSAGMLVVAISGELGSIRYIPPAAQVPFAEVRGAIAAVLQLARKRWRFRVEEVSLLGAQVPFSLGQITGDLP